MSQYYSKLEAALKSVREVTDFVPRVAVVLGSGLGALADEVDDVAVIPYRNIEGFPLSTVEGHKGRLVLGYLMGTPVAVMQGRVHMYEGYSSKEVVMPTRLMHLLGAKILLLTNAAGGLDPDFSGGSLMLIRDHISSFVPSPLIGENVDELGTRFLDMSDVYSPYLGDIMLKCAEDLHIDLKEGIYCQFRGPQYETPAETRLIRMLGASAVGMSTAVEAIAARHCGMEVAGVTCITNMACGISNTKLTHEEVQEVAARVSHDFKSLVKEFISRLEE